jgi:hypothetical protein
MSELFPFFGGLFAGIVMSWLPGPKRRLQWLVIQGSVIGGVATFASGEYRFGWQFVLIDVALAIGAGLGGSVCAAIWNASQCFSRARNRPRKIVSALASAD